jgi:hypothetical protein
MPLLDLDFDPSRVPHVAYRDRCHDYRLTYAVRSEAAWSVKRSSRDDGDRLLDVDLAVGARRFPYIAYSLSYDLTAVAEVTSDGWLFHDVLDEYAQLGLAIGPDGSPALLYSESSGTFYTHLTERGWEYEVVNPDPMSGGFNSLAFMPDGTAVGAYEYWEKVNDDFLTHLELAYRDPLGWQSYEIDVEGAPWFPANPSVVVDRRGVIHVAYRYVTPDGQYGVRIAHGNRGSWVFDDLDYPIGNEWVGNPEIALDPFGNLHLGWQGYRGDVYYATAAVPEPEAVSGVGLLFLAFMGAWGRRRANIHAR